MAAMLKPLTLIFNHLLKLICQNQLIVKNSFLAFDGMQEIVNTIPIGLIINIVIVLDAGHRVNGLILK